MENDIDWAQRHSGRFWFRTYSSIDRSSSYTIFKEDSGCYNIYEDSPNDTILHPKNYIQEVTHIAGPFDTLDAAKAAYLLIDTEEYT